MFCSGYEAYPNYGAAGEPMHCETGLSPYMDQQGGYRFIPTENPQLKAFAECMFFIAKSADCLECPGKLPKHLSACPFIAVMVIEISDYSCAMPSVCCVKL